MTVVVVQRVVGLGTVAAVAVAAIVAAVASIVVAIVGTVVVVVAVVAGVVVGGVGVVVVVVGGGGVVGVVVVVVVGGGVVGVVGVVGIVGGVLVGTTSFVATGTVTGSIEMIETAAAASSDVVDVLFLWHRRVHRVHSVGARSVGEKRGIQMQPHHDQFSPTQHGPTPGTHVQSLVVGVHHHHRVGVVLRILSILSNLSILSILIDGFGGFPSQAIQPRFQHRNGRGPFPLWCVVVFATLP